MKFDKMESAGYLANHMARLFARELHQRIRPLGIAPAQFAALLELWHEDGLTQRQLVERLDVEQATMANTIARMERDGLIVRKPHACDKRARSICLTAHARALQAEATQAAATVNEVALGTLTKNQRAQFLRVMQTVIENLSR